MINTLAASYVEFFTGDFLVFGLFCYIVWIFQKKRDEDFYE